MGRGLDIVVDGGGSRLRAYLVEEGRVIDERERPLGVNPNIVGLEPAVERVAEVVRDLAAPVARRGKKPFDGIDGIYCGIAGLGKAMTRLAVSAGLRRLLGNRVAVASDAECLLAAARPPEGEVAVLIAGSGSIAMARDLSGRIRRAGGNLPTGGDPGGGLWLAARAAKSMPALAELDWRERPLAVDELARAGDWTARGLVEETSRELFALLEELLAKVEPGVLPLVIHGGLISGSEILRSALRRRIEEARLPLMPQRPRFDPRLGPLVLAGRGSESSWPEPAEAPIL